MVRVQVCDQDEASKKTVLAQKRSLERYLCNVQKQGGIDLTPTRTIGFTLLPETVRNLEQQLQRNLRTPVNEPEFYSWLLSEEDALPHTLAQFKATLRRKCDEHAAKETKMAWYSSYYKYEMHYKRLAYYQKRLRNIVRPN